VLLGTLKYIIPMVQPKRLLTQVGNKGHFTYTEHSKEIEKIEVYEDGNLLYDEYNQNIYSYIEFTIF
jgi:hypothetical protein